MAWTEPEHESGTLWTGTDNMAEEVPKPDPDTLAIAKALHFILQHWGEGWVIPVGEVREHEKVLRDIIERCEK